MRIEPFVAYGALDVSGKTDLADCFERSSDREGLPDHPGNETGLARFPRVSVDRGTWSDPSLNAMFLQFRKSLEPWLW